MKNSFIVKAGIAGVLLCSTAMSVQAKENPVTWGELMSPDAVAWSVMNALVGVARGWADISYDAVNIDLRRGMFGVSGLSVTPLGNLRCSISADAITFNEAGKQFSEKHIFSIAADNLVISEACLPGNNEMVTTTFADQSIDLDLGLTFQPATTALDVAMTASIRDGAVLTGSAVYSSFGVGMMPTGFPKHSDEPYIYGRLERAEVTFRNEGLWQEILASSRMPAVFLEPSAIEEMARETLSEILGPVRGNEFAAVIAEFVAKPETITLQIAPERPVFMVNFEPLDAKVSDMGLALALGLPAPRIVLLTSDELKDAQKKRAPEALRRKVGLALTYGDGAPRNPKLANELLSEIERDQEVNAALAILAREQSGGDAYQQLREAVSQGQPHLWLDKFEADMALDEILVMQADKPAGKPADTDFMSLGAIKQAASGYFNGAGRLRDYGLAYQMASLGAAAGDVSMGNLLVQLDTRFEDSKAWPDIREEAADTAMQEWLDRGLAEMLAQ